MLTFRHAFFCCFGWLFTLCVLSVATKQAQSGDNMGELQSFTYEIICPSSKILQFGQSTDNWVVT